MSDITGDLKDGAVGSAAEKGALTAGAWKQKGLLILALGAGLTLGAGLVLSQPQFWLPPKQIVVTVNEPTSAPPKRDAAELRFENELLLGKRERVGNLLHDVEKELESIRYQIKAKGMLSVDDLKARIALCNVELFRLHKEKVEMQSRVRIIHKKGIEEGSGREFLTHPFSKDPNATREKPLIEREVLNGMLVLIKLHEKLLLQGKGPDNEADLVSLRKYEAAINDLLKIDIKPNVPKALPADPLEEYVTELSNEIDMNESQARGIQERLERDRAALNDLEMLLVKERSLHDKSEQYRQKLDAYDEDQMRLKDAESRLLLARSK